MKRKLIAGFIVVLLLVAGFGVYKNNRGKSREKQPLKSSQRAKIIQNLKVSSDTLTKSSPEVDRIRKLSKDTNVIICVVDAARADHFGAYGYTRETTPTFDIMTKEGCLFERHYSQAPSTLPSTASLYSSKYPDTHGVNHSEYFKEGPIEIQPEAEFTFPIGMEAAGYKTALFCANNSASPVYGIGLGFQEAYYHKSLKPYILDGEGKFTPEVLVRAFDQWLQKNKDEKFFAYVHFIPPHRPYEQKEEMTKLFEGKTPPDFYADNYTPHKYLFPVNDTRGGSREHPSMPEWINLYDSNLHYGDWAVGEIRKLLEKNEIYDNTIFIITSDHGEGFGEHGYIWHSGGIYDEVTHIPLVIKLPGETVPGRKISALTQTIDLLPTVYDLLNIPFPGQEVQGKSLLPLLAGQAEKVRDYSFTKSNEPAKYMIRDFEYSLLVYDTPEWRALYDAQKDSAQKENIIADKPEAVKKLYAAFIEFANAQRYSPPGFPGVIPKYGKKGATEKHELTPEMKKELEQLGYL